ncbi:phage tail spike protein [Bacillus cereus]|uniref:Phage minor structural protein n=1 Tax=Bacillus cereus TIAC219 TaxID=718222 RepID=A0ABC9SP24_BACCE|nr:phage tail spike protein [Bacillus cereus]EJP84127.1 phage minor structural protein [Bacillus cereus VD022]EOQ55024.1 phage minor structural protein [Bacillus cereus TIAC219]
MRTPSGILHVVDSQTDQIIGAIQSKDYWNDNRHWEIKNNVDKLDFTVFDGTKEAAALTQQNLVLKEVRGGRIVPYTITETEKDSNNRSLTTYASGEWILLGKANYIDPQKFEAKTVGEYVDIALKGTKWKKGNISYESFRSMTVDEFIDPLSFLKKIASLFELEIQYRTEVVGNHIERYVDMMKKRGQDTGKTIELEKDLIGIKRIENSQNICTALIGFVKGEGDNIITIEKINNGLPYITNIDAFQRWNEKGKHKFGFYSPETDNENMSPERLKTLMEIEMKKCVNASVSYEVKAASIGRVFGLAHELINEGDTIRIKDTGFTPKLYLEARAIAGDESFTDPTQDKYVFGDYREIVDPNEELRKIYNQILGSLGSKQEMLDQLEKLVKENGKTIETIRKESQAAKELAEKVQENLKNNTVNIIEAKNPPTDNLIVGKTLWRDISNGKPGILKVWNGKGWELLIPDVESIKKDTLEQVNKDIQLTKEELNKKVEAAQGETNGQFNKVTESLQEVTRTISSVQNSQGEIDKKVTSLQQTNERFTKSIEALTRENGEINNKLNTVEDTVEGTIQIISDVKETTNDLTKTTNEIKNTATSNKQTIEQLQTDMSNISVGSINLASDSETGLNKQNMTGTWSDSKQMTLSDKINYRNKTFTMSFLFTGKMTKFNTNPWFGVETAITYTDGEQEWKSIRADSKLKVNVDYKDEPLSVTFKTKDKDVTQIRFYYSGRNIDGNLNSHHAKFEEGNIRTTWQLSNEEVTSKVAFTKKTTEIEQSVKGIKETITDVENNQSGFDKRVTAVEKTADSISQSVGKVQEIQNQQGKTLSEANTTIGQHSEALKLTMKKKDVEDYVGGLGTVNELRDADFKLGQKYWFWNSGNGAAGSVDTNLKYKGMNTFAITVTGQTQDRWWGLTSQFIDCQVNEDFVASGYFNTDGKTPIDSGGAFIEIEWWTADKKTRIKTARTNIVVVNNTWVRAVCTDKAPANAAFVRWRYYVTRNGRLWCAAPMLQRGTIATEFWLHPKDQTDADKMIEDIANRVATKDYDKKVTELERSIAANEEGVTIISGKQESFINETYNAYVKKTESKLQVLDEGILAQILKDGIVTAINMAPGKITINAAKLDINADTVVKWLTAKGIDANLIRISGDKITIDGEEGVIVNMLDFLFKDEWGTKTTAVSRRNLIADPDFSSVTKKNIGHNDYYGFEGGYGLTWRSWGNVVIEKNTHIFDYEQMVNAARVDMYNYPEAIVNNGIHPGNEYTLSAHFRTAMINGVRKTGKPRLQVCCVKFRDNVSYDIWNEQKMDFPEPSTYYGEIRRYSFTFKVPTNYIPQQHALIIKVCSGNADMRQGTAICVSGVTLYSGKYASMYNWDRAAAERADGIQPFNALAVGGVNNNITPAPDGQTFDISTEKEVKIFRNIRAMQGINLGGGGFQQWGHIRFTDGNAGAGFYVSTPSGWKFNTLG